MISRYLHEIELCQNIPISDLYLIFSENLSKKYGHISLNEWVRFEYKKTNTIHTMNNFKEITPATFEAIKNVGKILNLHSIHLAPIKPSIRGIIEIYSNNDGDKNNGYHSSRMVNSFRKMNPYMRNNDFYQRIKLKKIKPRKNNPFVTHIQSGQIEVALIYDKGADTSLEWTAEEMELLDLISHFVEVDLFFGTSNSFVKKTREMFSE